MVMLQLIQAKNVTKQFSFVIIFNNNIISSLILQPHILIKEEKNELPVHFHERVVVHVQSLK